MLKYYYLAYGSNLNLYQMNFRCPSSKVIGSTILRDYRLVYKGTDDNFAYLTIEKHECSKVPLGLFELSDIDILSLDQYEGYPELYSKKYMPIKVGNKINYALIYIMNDGYDYHIPDIDYISTCIDGYNDFGFDMNILNNALQDTIVNLPKKKGKK